MFSIECGMVCGGQDGRSTARWGAVECAHTHITRSDYPRKAWLSSRNWGWALSDVILQELELIGELEQRSES